MLRQLPLNGRVIINSADPLRDLIQQSPVLASIAAVLLLTCCSLLIAFRRQHRRLAITRMQLKSLRCDINRLQGAHDGLLLQILRKPKENPLSNKSEEKMTRSRPAIQPDEIVRDDISTAPG